ncbi:MAG TPA: porin [Nitrospiria bacterium]|nr:porin [Nitrospiria bacterium]
MKDFRFVFLVAVWIGFVWGSPRDVLAQDASTPPETVDERIEVLDRKIQMLEKRLEAKQGGVLTTPEKASAARAGNDGFSLVSADGDFRLKLGGILQADGRFYVDDPYRQGTNTFLLRTVRPVFEGTVYRYYDFRLMPDFGGGTTVIQDAYMDIRYWPEAVLRVGKFKTPFGIERLQNETDLLFVERALPNNLVPNRDIGLQWRGDLWGEAFDYALGVVDGVPDGGSSDGDTNDNKDFVARLFAQPFKNGGLEPLRGLGLGVAGTYGKQRGTATSPNLPSFKTDGQLTFFNYRSDGTGSGTAVAAGEHDRVSPQVFYYWRSFGLLGEYVRSSQEVSRGSNSARLSNQGWQAAASYVLTGDAASYQGVKPKSPFDPHKGTWGAFELAARFGKLTVDGDAFPLYADPAKAAQEASAWAAGVNWYLNNNVKIVTDYDQTGFKGGAANGGDRKDEKAVLSRFQIAF